MYININLCQYINFAFQLFLHSDFSNLLHCYYESKRMDLHIVIKKPRFQKRIRGLMVRMVIKY